MFLRRHPDKYYIRFGQVAWFAPQGGIHTTPYGSFWLLMMRPSSYTYCASRSITSPCGPRMVTSKGIWPGRLCVAQPKHGS